METILDIHKIPNLHNVLATAGNIASLDSQEENSDKILHNCYGVVPKGLLTFLGNLYKESVKTTSGLWYTTSRDKPPENLFSL